MRHFRSIEDWQLLYIPLLCALLVFTTIAPATARLVHFNNPAVKYEGRIVYKADAAELSWSGNSVTIIFVGTAISAVLEDNDTGNYYNVVVDDQVISKIHTDTAKQTYLLAAGLSKAKHKVTLYKRTEWDKGKTLFYGFSVSDDALLLPKAPALKRKIEFYGNSITCGFGMEDSSGKDRGFGYFENNYLSYAALTARHYNAQYSCIAKSGIGIMVSWFPLIMPEMYDRADPTDPASKWDFKKYIPDVVVINLFQNDSWIVERPSFQEFRARFGNNKPTPEATVKAYKDFVARIRGKYPKSTIICVLGNMDATRKGSPWPQYVQTAVAQLNDPKILTHFFEYKNTSGHPNVAEQQMMAESLIRFMDEHVNW